MENATKAMIIVASAIIAVMVLSIMVYLFTHAARVPVQYENSKHAESIAEFNAKFEKYAIVADLNESGDLDEYNSGSKTINETDIPSNSFADVITVCNLAYDINCKYENDPTNNVIVDIIIDGNYYCVYPMADNGRPVLQKGQVFEGKSENVTATSTVVELFDLMEQGYDGTSFNEANYDDQNRLRYKYYFDSQILLNLFFLLQYIYNF